MKNPPAVLAHQAVSPGDTALPAFDVSCFLFNSVLPSIAPACCSRTTLVSGCLHATLLLPRVPTAGCRSCWCGTVLLSTSAYAGNSYRGPAHPSLPTLHPVKKCEHTVAAALYPHLPIFLHYIPVLPLRVHARNLVTPAARFMHHIVLGCCPAAFTPTCAWYLVVCGSPFRCCRSAVRYLRLLFTYP